MDYVTFERRLLHLIFRTNAPLTPVHVAYYLDLPIAEARTHLDHMVEQGILELDSDAEGHLLYTYPMRPPPGELPPPRPPKRRKKKRGALDPLAPPGAAGASTGAASSPPKEVRETALVPRASLRESGAGDGPSQGTALTTQASQYEVLMVDGRRYYSPAAAAALSLFLPGVGQIYTGRVPQGVGWMLATGMGYLFFLIPGLILHICCVVNAAAVPARVPIIAERLPERSPAK
jgi:TM2 domain-containing membrane protein YozV